MKICKRCSIELDVSKFGKNKNNKDGFSIYCLECEIKRAKEYREKNREKVNNSAKNWRNKNPEKYKKTIQKYLEKNPQMSSKERSKKYRENEEYRLKLSKKSKERYQNNIEEEREKRKKYYYENKKRERKKNDDWRKKKLKNDGFFRMKRRLRERIRDYMKGKNIGKKTKEIVGLEYEEFKTYISDKFTEGMNWENYGEWHLDHIIPLCEAKNKEEVIKLNHYTNLQPLWAKDNLKKNRKYGS
jgi:hypothetical protein